MPVLLAQLVAPQFLATSETTYYTAPVAANTQPATTAKISRAVFINTSGGALTVTAGITAGATLTAGNTILSVSIPANQTYVSPEFAGVVIPSGSLLRASTTSATSVIIMISGLTSQ